MENAKNIIATFLKVEPSEITENTFMDKSAIPGSILIHRMYSTLSSEGYHIVNHDSIRTYGDFLNALNHGKSSSETPKTVKKDIVKKEKNVNTSSGMKVGIDIEDIINMPVVSDYREEKFYTENFSSKEISYCILQADPRASFAGKFSLKEAIIKADNSYKSVPFKEIEILNDSLGKPYFGDFALSISHTTNQAVAVAIKGSIVVEKERQLQKSVTTEEVEKLINSSLPTIEDDVLGTKLNYISITLSIIAIVLVIYFNL